MGGLFDQLTAGPTTADPQERDAPSAHSGGTASVSGMASRDIRDAGLELLKHGLVEELRKPSVYRTICAHREALDHVIRPLDLQVRHDEIRGLAFLVVAEGVYEDTDEEWSHPLVRRQRLTLEQSLLVALLRQHFVAHELEAGVGAGEAFVALDDLLPQLQVFLGPLGSGSLEKRRLLALLEQLKGHGLVSDIDDHERVTVRPLIVHLANPESLHQLVLALRQMGQRRAEATKSDEGEAT